MGNNFIIQNDILERYLGVEEEVIIPDGVR